MKTFLQQLVGIVSHVIGKIMAAIGMLELQILRNLVKLVNA